MIGQSVLLSHFLRMRQQQAARQHHARRTHAQPIQTAPLTYPFQFYLFINVKLASLKSIFHIFNLVVGIICVLV